MGDAISVLLVEDDSRLAKFTADYLNERDAYVTHVSDGEAALAEVKRQRFDVVVLDIMLPKLSGLAVCSAIRRESDVPIVFVTARVEEADRVLGLELGGDDYVLKPFSPRELLARVRAFVRRSRGEAGPRAKTLRVGELTLQTGNRSVTLGRHAVTLTSAEFDLLVTLAQHPGRVLSREQLLRLARGSDAETFDRAIDVQISRLRQKLAVYEGGGALIQTVRGVGYMLAGGDEAR
jgi:two-component system, OmpR family, response regulator